MDSNPTTKGHDQWIHITVNNKMSSGDLLIQNSGVSQGKFYEWPDKDKEISASEVDKRVAGPGRDIHIAACGKLDSDTGTEGSFDMHDGDVKVCHVYWHCPWASLPNKLRFTKMNNEYDLQKPDVHASGAIGNVTVTVARKT